MIILRKIFLYVAALALVPICRAEEPLHIAKQGSMEAGGRTIDCPSATTGAIPTVLAGQAATSSSTTSMPPISTPRPALSLSHPV